MREIKFRVWFKRSGYMCYLNDKDYLLNSDGLYERYDVPYCGYDYRLVSPDEYELMQFTGRHDKNGKEIYEGDVCLIPDDTDPECPENLFAVVVFNTVDGNWQLQTIPDKYHRSVKEWLCEFGDECEVIGNKWDNPELLEQ